MGLVFMPKRSAIIILLVLGAICLVDGIVKKDVKEILVALSILIYALVSLTAGKKKDPASQNDRACNNSINPNR